MLPTKKRLFQRKFLWQNFRWQVVSSHCKPQTLPISSPAPAWVRILIYPLIVESQSALITAFAVVNRSFQRSFGQHTEERPMGRLGRRTPGRGRQRKDSSSGNFSDKIFGELPSTSRTSADAVALLERRIGHPLLRLPAQLLNYM
jgi:hypothetical protein